MNKELLEKYLGNNCNEHEVDMVLSWFRDSAGTVEGKALLNRIWEELPLTDSGSATDFDFLLDRIHHDINIHQTNLFIESDGNNQVKYYRRRYMRFIRNAAAVLLIPVLGLGLFYSYKYYTVKTVQTSGIQACNEVISSPDAITKVTLPDGSEVWLNHSSSLRYPAVFDGNSRNVELKGEGYFEVVHNPKKPFIVNTGEIEIIARGTVFNVMAYPYENKVETSLISGRVDLVRLLENGKTVTLFNMNPNDHTIYLKQKDKIIAKTIYDDRYFSWKDGKLIFTSERMEKVTNILSRWFNVDIQIMDPELNNLTLTATFVNETLPQVMELLTISLPVKYKISDREKNADGSFTRRKVFIYK